jgi:hypothetical protein
VFVRPALRQNCPFVNTKFSIRPAGQYPLKICRPLLASYFLHVTLIRASLLFLSHSLWLSLFLCFAWIPFSALIFAPACHPHYEQKKQMKNGKANQPFIRPAGKASRLSHSAVFSSLSTLRTNPTACVTDTRSKSLAAPFFFSRQRRI